MRAVFEHSWRLLTEVEQALLCQLAVFRGGFTLQAAREVAGATPITLTRLRYKSLAQGAGSGRYDIHGLLGRLALEKLGATPGLEAGARRRHSDYFLTYVGQRATALQGETPQVAAERSGGSWTTYARRGTGP